MVKVYETYETYEIYLKSIWNQHQDHYENIQNTMKCYETMLKPENCTEGVGNESECQKLALIDWRGMRQVALHYMHSMHFSLISLGIYDDA